MTWINVSILSRNPYSQVTLKSHPVPNIFEQYILDMTTSYSFLNKPKIEIFANNMKIFIEKVFELIKLLKIYSWFKSWRHRNSAVL